MPEAKTKYRVLVGLNYTPVGKKEETRKEPGDLVTDLPRSSVRGLLDQGCIKEVK
jgi:hypothetical protein